MRLIPPRAEDDEAVAVLRSHPKTLRYLRFLPTHVTPDEARVRRENRASNPTIVDFHIHIKKKDGSFSFEGNTGLFNVDETNKSCEIGILLSPHLHRKGYATEALYLVLKHAFEDRKMHRASFETGADNLPMCSWLEKVLGATLEARRRECWSDMKGGYTDVHSYSILEWEWSGGVREKLENLVIHPVAGK
ncbi:hypothetical protein C0993_000696 [Termitomyces sp. T159_Od127]|nr:hypothetical protein C0993_000696 [Termitomyces sp. T159_Od127]